MDLQITPTHSFASAPKLDIVVIPGGDIESAKRSKATQDWIKTSAPTARHILSVCNGAFILAETGLLNGLSATTFYRALDDFKKSYPRVNTLSNQRLVDNGKMITAGGLSAGIDAALYVVSLFDRPSLWVEFAVYVGLGIVWALPFRAVFRGVGQPDPDAPEDGK